MSLSTIIQSHAKQIDFTNPEMQKNIQDFIIKTIMCQYGEIHGYSMSDTLMNLKSGPFLDCEMEDILDEIENDS